MMRILVSGASGFVGKHLIKLLSGKGFNVTTLSRTEVKEGKVKKLYVKDYSPASIANVLQDSKFDAVIHLVGAGSSPADRNIYTLTCVNAILPGVMVEAASKLGVKGFVMAGTYAEYAQPHGQLLLAEHSALEKNDPYGTSKAAGAEFALQQGAFYDIPVAVGRFFNLYGPGDTLQHRLFPSLVNRLLIGEGVPLSKGEQMRDFVYIQDACEALIAILEGLLTGKLSSACYNVASGVPCSVSDFAKKTANALGVPNSLLQFGALPPRTVPDAPFMVGNPSLLKERIGWSCRYTLDDGLAESAQAYGRPCL